VAFGAHVDGAVGADVVGAELPFIVPFAEAPGPPAVSALPGNAAGGAVVGGAVGAMVGRAVGADVVVPGDATGGAVVGGAVGAMVGRALGVVVCAFACSMTTSNTPRCSARTGCMWWLR
jgi:hypothetical protein